MKPTAIIVSVGYAQELAVTLSQNAKHFGDVLVVTDTNDQETAEVARSVPNADLFRTEVFHADQERPFSKDHAINEALEYLGPCGWTLLLDADILLPDKLQWPELSQRSLYGAHRRMCRGLSPNDNWKCYRVQPDVVMAGYFQLFHSDDPRVQPWPNYPTERLTWYSDTVFQDRWPPNAKHWLSFDVLHIGDPPGQNWLGRSEEAREQLKQLRRNPDNTRWQSKWK